MAAIGDLILMVDADGATDINEFDKCVDKVSNDLLKEISS